jgi:hypothetical protein
MEERSLSNPNGDGPELDEAVVEHCADCGQQVDAASERGFPVGAEAVLCFECAVARGGRWDEDQQRWTTEPEFGDLGEGFE